MKARTFLFIFLVSSVIPLCGQTDFVGPEDKTKRAAYYQGKDILKIPTFIVFVDGLEKGRIVEVPQKSLEEDLVAIIER